MPGNAGNAAANGLAVAAGTRQERGDNYMAGKGVRIKFPQRAGLFVFQVNPQSTKLTIPARINTTQTLGGPSVDSFGKALPQGQISGTAGWGVPLADPLHGKTGLLHVLELKRLYEEWLNATVEETQPIAAACDLFIDFQNQMYQVVFDGLELTQQKTYTIDYSLTYTVLFDYNAPVVRLPLAQLDQPGAATDGSTPAVPGDDKRPGFPTGPQGGER